MAEDTGPSEGGHPAPPRAVILAARLMYAGAVITVLEFIVGFLLSLDQERAVIRSEEPGISVREVEADIVAGVIPVSVLLLIAVTLWVWMARKNLAGRQWARFVSSTLFGLATLFTLYVLFPEPAHPVRGIEIATVIAFWMIGLAATILIWWPGTAAHYGQDHPSYSLDSTEHVVLWAILGVVTITGGTIGAVINARQVILLDKASGHAIAHITATDRKEPGQRGCVNDLTVRFRADDREITGELCGEWEQKVGDTFRVRFARSDPTVFEPEHSDNHLVDTWVCGVMALVGIAWTAWCIRELNRRRTATLREEEETDDGQ